MNRSKQATLFQSWGGKSLSQQAGKSGTSAKQQKQDTESEKASPDVISLLDSDIDAEDQELALALEQSIAQYERDRVKPAPQPCQQGLQSVESCDGNVSFGIEEQDGEHGIDRTSCLSQWNPANPPVWELQGYDPSAGGLWIYPTNYPVREYQFSVVRQALVKNTLVTLPTGLGKTFIAAVVMYNFYRWYPEGRVVFMAPTKPLVAQQIEACYNIMGIPRQDTAEMTGSMNPTDRKKAWRDRRVFFLTPQVMTNDMSRGTCSAEAIKLVVVDEAHKALGNHAYCQVVRELAKYTQQFRVLALSATPGNDITAVQKVVSNLLVSHIELRSEDSPDIKPYTHERTIDKIVVPLGEDLNRVKLKYTQVLQVIVKRLIHQRVLYNRETTSLSKFLVLKARDAFRQNPPESMPRSQYGIVEGDFALAMSLYHGYELLHQHGLRPLYNYLEGIMDGTKSTQRTRSELMKNADFMEVMELLKEKLHISGQAKDRAAFLLVGHPKLVKLEEVVLEHFQRFQAAGDATRVMIFSQYRDSVQEITTLLQQHEPLVTVMSFIGQSSVGKGTKGFTQKEQLQVMQAFRTGGYNTLVSTCVGEEGLDIGDVDLIVCYDAHKSPVRLVQRMGRTGRKRQGRIVMLMTEGKEEQIYNHSQYTKRSIHRMIQNGAKSLVFYANNPRMIPSDVTPACHRMHITVPSLQPPDKPEGSSAKGRGKGRRTTSVPRANRGRRKMANSDNGGITVEEFVELKSAGCAVTCPALPRLTMLTLNSAEQGEGEEEGSSSGLSLAEWLPWQNSLQQTSLFGHSRRSRHLVQLMDFIDLQQALPPDEDHYGQEMKLYLDKSDVPPDAKRPRSNNIAQFVVPGPKSPPERRALGAKKTDVTRRKRKNVIPTIEPSEHSDDSDFLPEVDLCTAPGVSQGEKRGPSGDRKETKSGSVSPEASESMDGTESAQLLSPVPTPPGGKCSVSAVEDHAASHTLGIHDFQAEVDPPPDSACTTRPERLVAPEEVSDGEPEEDGYPLKDSDPGSWRQYCRWADNVDPEWGILKRLKETDTVTWADVYEEFKEKVSELESIRLSDEVDSGMDGIQGPGWLPPVSKKDRISERSVCTGGNLMKPEGLVPVTDDDQQLTRPSLSQESRKRSLSASVRESVLEKQQKQLGTEVNETPGKGHKSLRDASVSDSFIHKNFFDDDDDDDFEETNVLPATGPVRPDKGNVSLRVCPGDQSKADVHGRDDVATVASSVSTLAAASPRLEAGGARSEAGGVNTSNSMLTFTQALSFVHNHSSLESVHDNSNPKNAEVEQNDSFHENLQNRPSGAMVNEVLEVCDDEEDVPMTHEDEDCANEDEDCANEDEDCAIEDEDCANEDEDCANEDEDCANEDEDCANFDLGYDFDEDIIPPSPEGPSVSQVTWRSMTFSGQPALLTADQRTEGAATTEGTEHVTHADVEDVACEDMEDIACEDIEDVACADIEDVACEDIEDVACAKDVACADIEYVACEDIACEDIEDIACEDIEDVACADDFDDDGTLLNVIEQGLEEGSPRFSSSVQSKPPQDSDIDKELSPVPPSTADSVTEPCADSSHIPEVQLPKIAKRKLKLGQKSLASSSKPEVCLEAAAAAEVESPCRLGAERPNISGSSDGGAASRTSHGTVEKLPSILKRKDRSSNVSTDKLPAIKPQLRLSAIGTSHLNEDSFVGLGDFPSEFPELSDGNDFEAEADPKQPFIKVSDLERSPVLREKSTVFCSTPMSGKRSSLSTTRSELNRTASASKMIPPFPLDLEDDDFEESVAIPRNPIRKRVRLLTPDSADEEDDNDVQEHKSSPKKKKKKDQKRKRRCGFLDDEAELSDDVEVSTDEEEENMEALEGSFIDNCTQMTQASQIDMQAVYMKSVRSPGPGGAHQRGRFRLQFHPDPVDVFSQPPTHLEEEEGEEESQYQEDSFCVGSEEESGFHDSEEDENLTTRTVRRKKRHAVKQMKGRRRVHQLADSSSEDENEDCDRLPASQIVPSHKKSVRALLSSSDEHHDTSAGKATTPSPSRHSEQERDVRIDLKRRVKLMQGDEKSESSQGFSASDGTSFSGRVTSVSKISRNCDNLELKQQQRKNLSVPDRFGPDTYRLEKAGDQGSLLSVEKMSHTDSVKAFAAESPLLTSEDVVSKSSTPSASSSSSGHVFNTPKGRRADGVPADVLVRRIGDGGDSLEEKGATYPRAQSHRSADSSSSSSKFTSICQVPRERGKVVVFVDSREISGTQDIVSALRLEHNIHVCTRQLAACDYILSNRMAVERIVWSNFCNSSNRSKLTQRLKHMLSLYDRCVMIVEKDRVKPGEEKNKKFQHHTKYVDSLTSHLCQIAVQLFFTENQSETAGLLAQLTTLECRKDMAITVPVDLSSAQEQVVRFYLSLPRLSITHALNLCSNFTAIQDFMQSSVKGVETKGHMSVSRATEVVNFVRRRFSLALCSKK
ncbi:hypothetical protein ACOMHN_020794 [Nucella lapillus]